MIPQPANAFPFVEAPTAANVGRGLAPAWLADPAPATSRLRRPQAAAYIV